MKLANRLGLAAALAAACCAAQAKDLRCDVDSEYDLTLTEQSLVLTRDTGTPRAIVMRQGRLFIDDRWVALTAADSKRIADYERQARGIMPLAQQIGRDAADIAFTTLGEVAAGLSSTPAETRAHLDQARSKIDARLARSVTATRFNGDDLGKGIAEAIGETLPVVIGDIVGGAISAAFSGDEARLDRMNRIDKDIERRVEPRAKQLEQRAELLCRRMEALDTIDDALGYRLPNGDRLDLLDANVEIRNSASR